LLRSFSPTTCLRPRRPLFPYTTLFRSEKTGIALTFSARRLLGSGLIRKTQRETGTAARASREQPQARALLTCIDGIELLANAKRSEEHTSELQSLAYLVCRLLLEKKNA